MLTSDKGLFILGPTHVVYMAHSRTVGDYLMPPHISSEEEEAVATKGSTSKSAIISHVVSIGISGVDGFLQQRNDDVPATKHSLKNSEAVILISFRKFETAAHDGNMLKCAWWDSGSGEFQTAAEDGHKRCWLRETNDTTAVCACSMVAEHFALVAVDSGTPSRGGWAYSNSVCFSLKKIKI